MQRTATLFEKILEYVQDLAREDVVHIKWQIFIKSIFWY